MYVHICMYICVYIYINTSTHTHTHTHIHIHIYTHIIYRQTKKTMKKKLVLYSKVKRNQPDRCRFYKADMDKHVASIV